MSSSKNSFRNNSHSASILLKHDSCTPSKFAVCGINSATIFYGFRKERMLCDHLELNMGVSCVLRGFQIACANYRDTKRNRDVT